EYPKKDPVQQINTVARLAQQDSPLVLDPPRQRALAAGKEIDQRADAGRKTPAVLKHQRLILRRGQRPSDEQKHDPSGAGTGEERSNPPLFCGRNRRIAHVVKRGNQYSESELRDTAERRAIEQPLVIGRVTQSCKAS